MISTMNVLSGQLIVIPHCVRLKSSPPANTVFDACLSLTVYASPTDKSPGRIERFPPLTVTGAERGAQRSNEIYFTQTMLSIGMDSEMAVKDTDMVIIRLYNHSSNSSAAAITRPPVEVANCNLSIKELLAHQCKYSPSQLGSVTSHAIECLNTRTRLSGNKGIMLPLNVDGITVNNSYNQINNSRQNDPNRFGAVVLCVHFIPFI